MRVLDGRSLLQIMLLTYYQDFAGSFFIKFVMLLLATQEIISELNNGNRTLRWLENASLIITVWLTKNGVTASCDAALGTFQCTDGLLCRSQIIRFLHSTSFVRYTWGLGHFTTGAVSMAPWCRIALVLLIHPGDLCLEQMLYCRSFNFDSKATFLPSRLLGGNNMIYTNSFAL